jgi:hypothetical protein
MARLDSVIERLEQGAVGDEDEQTVAVALGEGLAVLARIMEVTLVVSELVSRFRG